MSEPLGNFLKKFVGPVNVWVAMNEDMLIVKAVFNNYRVIILCFSFRYSVCILFSGMASQTE